MKEMTNNVALNGGLHAKTQIKNYQGTMLHN
jgi:hypothetical protein